MKFLEARRFNAGSAIRINPAFIVAFSFENAGQAVQLTLANGPGVLIDNPFCDFETNGNEAEKKFLEAIGVSE